MLNFRTVTDSVPASRTNLSFTARLLAEMPRDLAKPKSPMKLTVSQGDACMHLALWGWDIVTEGTLRANLGNVYQFSGVDIKRQIENCAGTHPFGGLLSSNPRPGTAHRSTFTLTEDNPSYLRREVKWEDLDRVLPQLALGRPPLHVNEDVYTSCSVSAFCPTRTYSKGCRQAMADAFSFCMWDGSPHEDVVDLTQPKPSSDSACPDCGRVPGPSNIFCPQKDELCIHPGCEELAREFLEDDKSLSN